jgi:tetratricopeptide (TPR) repeat protein
MLGKLDYVAGDMSAAERHFQAVAERSPPNLDGLLWLARVRSHEDRDVPGALAALDAVLTADSGNPEAWHLKGNLHERQGDLEQAMACYRYGMQSRKHLARIYLRLSAIYAQGDLPDESRRYLEDAAVLARDDPYLRKEVEAVRKAGR